MTSHRRSTKENTHFLLFAATFWAFIFIMIRVAFTFGYYPSSHITCMENCGIGYVFSNKTLKRFEMSALILDLTWLRMLHSLVWQLPEGFHGSLWIIQFWKALILRIKAWYPCCSKEIPAPTDVCRREILLIEVFVLCQVVTQIFSDLASIEVGGRVLLMSCVRTVNESGVGDLITSWFN